MRDKELFCCCTCAGCPPGPKLGPKAPPDPANKFAPNGVEAPDPLAPVIPAKGDDNVDCPAPENGGTPPKPGPPAGAPIIEARKGFAAPPVICGRSPCPNVDPPPLVALIGGELTAPKPVCGVLNPNPPADVGENISPFPGDVVLLPLPVTAGVVGEEPGIDGKVPRSDAPNDEDGLNGFMPPNPVDWGFSMGETVIDGAEEVEVTPVGWVDNVGENMESENVDPVVVVDVFWALRMLEGENPDALGLLSLMFPLFLVNANDEATLDTPVAPGLSAPELNPNPFNPLKAPVCWG